MIKTIKKLETDLPPLHKNVFFRDCEGKFYIGMIWRRAYADKAFVSANEIVNSAYISKKGDGARSLESIQGWEWATLDDGLSAIWNKER